MTFKAAQATNPSVLQAGTANWTVPAGIVLTDYLLVTTGISVPASWPTDGDNVTLTASRGTATVTKIKQLASGNLSNVVWVVTGVQAGDTLTTVSAQGNRQFTVLPFSNPIFVGTPTARGASTSNTAIAGPAAPTVGRTQYAVAIERTNTTGTPTFAHSAGLTVTQDFFYDRGDAATDPAISIWLGHTNWAAGATGTVTVTYTATATTNAMGFYVEEAPATVAPYFSSQPGSIVLLGDSTGNEPGEWPRLLATRFGRSWPTSTVQERLYTSASSTYAAAKTLWKRGGTTTTVYNGHVGSTTADYPTAVAGRLAAMIPVDPDVVILNYGHNHTTESAATFEGKLDTLIAAIQSLYPATPIVISSQNHQKSPATNAASHNARQAHLATYAASHGYGYINTYETFQTQTTPDSFVEADGVHPTDTGLGDGSHLWAGAAATFLLPATAAAYNQLTFAQRTAALAPQVNLRHGEPSGTVMVDSSGNGRDGAYQNGPTLGAAGALTGSNDTSTAATFNGVDQYGLIAKAAWMELTSWDATFMAWVKTTDTDGVLIGRSSSAPYMLRITTALGFYFEVRDATTGYYAADNGTANVRDGNWHLLVGTVRDGYVTTYVDGVQVAQNTGGSGPGAAIPKQDTAGMYVGTRSGGPYLAGAMDETTMVGYALTPAQISDLYTAGTTPPAAAPTPTVSLLWTNSMEDTAIRAGFVVANAASTRLAASTAANMAAPTYSGVTSTVDGAWHTARVTGLTAGTTYYVQLECDGALTGDVMRVKTLAPGSPRNFTFLTGSCQSTGSNHAVFDRMALEDADFFIHQGDLHYADTSDAATWRAAFLSSMNAAKFKAMRAKWAMDYQYDNHDWAGQGNEADDWDPTTNPRSMVKELAAEYPLAGNLYKTWAHGRVRFFHTDLWSERDPDEAVESSTKRCMSQAQEDQFLADLAAAKEPVLVWIAHWPLYTSTAAGRWGSYSTQRDRIKTWLAARPGIRNRMVAIGGDSHSVSADSGANQSALGPIPTLNASPFNQSGAAPTGTWDVVNYDVPDTAGVYSRVTVTDNGRTVTFKWEAVDDTGAVVSTATWTRKVGTPTVWNGVAEVPAVFSVMTASGEVPAALELV